MASVGFADKVAFVWKVADNLRGTFKQHEYGSGMLPLLVLRRMDAVLAPTKDAVLDTAVKTGVLASDARPRSRPPMTAVTASSSGRLVGSSTTSPPDLHLDVRPTGVSNEAMGYVFEELLREFSEMSNETAGEHYTPREVIDLVVELLLHSRTHAELTKNPKPVRTVYAPLRRSLKTGELRPFRCPTRSNHSHARPSRFRSSHSRGA